MRTKMHTKDRSRKSVIREVGKMETGRLSEEESNGTQLNSKRSAKIEDKIT